MKKLVNAITSKEENNIYKILKTLSTLNSQNYITISSACYELIFEGYIEREDFVREFMNRVPKNCYEFLDRLNEELVSKNDNNRIELLNMSIKRRWRS